MPTKFMNIVILALVVVGAFQGYNGWKLRAQQQELIAAVEARAEASKAVAFEMNRLCKHFNCEQPETEN